MDSSVLVGRNGAVATVTINRPKALNALDPDTLRALAVALDEVGRDAGVRALVVTGAGDRAFVAGADIAAMQAMAPDAGREYCRLGHEVFARLEALPFPAVAAVNGAALGGGLELALACDLRVAAKNAKVGLPEVTLGIYPAAGGTWRLPRVVGLGRARDLVFTGRIVDADEAFALGIFERLVETDALGAAKALAAEIAKNDPLSVQVAKVSLNTLARGGDPSTTERLAQALLFDSPEKHVRMTAFLEKKAKK